MGSRSTTGAHHQCKSLQVDSETSASKAGRMHGRQRGQSGGSDLLVMISLTLGWLSLVGSWPDSPFFIGAPDSCTGAKVNLLPGDIPKHPPLASFPLFHVNL